MSAPEKLLTTAQVARELGISPRTVVRYADRGWITPTRVLPSGHRRWRLTDVRDQLAALPGRGDDE
jgi:excisionase family DNA binding protein